MITVIHEGKTNFYYGKHDDTKPIGTLVGNGSIFYEIDTQDVYIYDGDTDSWLIQE